MAGRRNISLFFSSFVVFAFFFIDDHSKNNNTNFAKHTCHERNVIMNGADVGKSSWWTLSGLKEKT